MYRNLAFLFVILSCFSASLAQTTAFIGVNVIPMDRERVLQRQTVLIRDGVIVEIGKKLTIPRDAKRIDGSGKYLMPGLADMHVHIFGEDELGWYVANGVTTVRNMWGFDSHLVMRRKIAAGELIGPTIFTSGSIVDGKPPQLRGMAVIDVPEDADQIVKSQKYGGYDFVKLYNRLTPRGYDAVFASARKYGLRVVGHVPKEVGLEHALRNRQYSIEHLYGYLDATSSQGNSGNLNWEAALDKKKIRAVARRTKASGTWNCPTLIVSRKLELFSSEIDTLLKLRQIEHLPRQLKRMFPKPESGDKTIAPDVRSKRDANRGQMVMALRDAGAGILVGTDTGNPYVLPGFDIHEELKMLVEAGLTPYEAIQAATKNAAKFLERNDFGMVAIGRRADLILIEGNPLINVAETMRIAGVFVQGRWLNAADLRVMVYGKQ